MNKKKISFVDMQRLDDDVRTVEHLRMELARHRSSMMQFCNRFNLSRFRLSCTGQGYQPLNDIERATIAKGLETLERESR